MALPADQRAQLDQLVQHLEDSGKSEQEIMATVNDFKTKYDQPEPAKVTPAGKPPVTPGVISTIGALTAANADKVRPVMATAGKFMAESPIAQRVAGGIAGAIPMAMPLPSLVKGPAMVAAYGAGRRYAGKAGEAMARMASLPKAAHVDLSVIEKLAEQLGMNPEMLAKAATTFGEGVSATTGQRAMGMLTKRLIPGLGYGLMAADAVQMAKPHVEKWMKDVTDESSKTKDPLMLEMMARALQGS